MPVLACTAAVVPAVVHDEAAAQPKAQLVELKFILDQPSYNSPTDPVR